MPTTVGAEGGQKGPGCPGAQRGSHAVQSATQAAWLKARVVGTERAPHPFTQTCSTPFFTSMSTFSADTGIPLPGCALCHLNDRYADELGFLPWTCPACGHCLLANNSVSIDGPWGGPPLNTYGICTNCVYGDEWHLHDPLPDACLR